MPDILPASCGWSDDSLTSKATSSVTCQSKYDKKEASPHGLASFIFFIFLSSSFLPSFLLFQDHLFAFDDDDATIGSGDRATIESIELSVER